MDPITAVGAVASIITLAQTALSLSTTLYGLGGALLSASEDLKCLADDLKTFSQSLSLLSRLLEDSKSWYSDDIYLLTAKVIKDCADLYVKIDGILSKLGGKGKTNWMKRMKYVMKESQIRKLLRRLRDLKGTLATILMSLQVDLQLSLLNISSSSKLQRAPDVPLQPYTVQTLREAQEAVRTSRLLSIQATKSDGFIQVHVEEKSPEVSSIGLTDRPAALQMHSNSIMMFQQVSNTGNTIPTSTGIPGPPRSLKSVSSSDSFKSALGEQDTEAEIIREVEGVLHAFRTALEVLEKVKKRIDDEDKALRFEAEKLNYSLMKGLDINQAHGSHHKKHGEAYLSAFRSSQAAVRQLRGIMTKLMGELVTTLHVYSAAYEVLSPEGFQQLHYFSEKCRIKTLFELDRLAMLLFPQPVRLILYASDPASYSEYVSPQTSPIEVRVTENDVDQRISADYDNLIRRAKLLDTPFGTFSPNEPEYSTHQRIASYSAAASFQTTTFKNSRYNELYFDNPNFQPEQWNPDSDSYPGEPNNRRDTSSPMYTLSFGNDRDEYADADADAVADEDTLSEYYSGRISLVDEELGDFESAMTHLRPRSRRGRQTIQMELWGTGRSDQTLGFFDMSVDSTSNPPMTTADVLQEFDFDSFLHEDISGSNQAGERRESVSVQLPDTPAAQNRVPQAPLRDFRFSQSFPVSRPEFVKSSDKCEGFQSKSPFFEGATAGFEDNLIINESRGGSQIRSGARLQYQEQLLDEQQSKKRLLLAAVTDKAQKQRKIDERGVRPRSSSLSSRSSAGLGRGSGLVALGTADLSASAGEKLLDQSRSKSRSRTRHRSLSRSKNRSRSRSHNRYFVSGAYAFAGVAIGSVPQLKRKNKGARRRRQRKLEALKDEERLWRLTFMTLKDTQPVGFRSLASTISFEFGFPLPLEPGFETAGCDLIAKFLNKFSLDQNSDAQLRDAHDHRKNIIEVTQAVSGSLGLENSALAWTCIAALIQKYEPIFSPLQASPSLSLTSDHLCALNSTFSQLAAITSMIARYAVMENLYAQNAALTLRADYKAALLALCCRILTWFVPAFKVADAIRNGLSGDVSASELAAGLEVVWEEIKEMDRVCQRFAVVVEERGEESGSGSGSEDNDEEEGVETPASEADGEDADDSADCFWLPERDQDKNVEYQSSLAMEMPAEITTT